MKLYSTGVDIDDVVHAMAVPYKTLCGRSAPELQFTTQSSLWSKIDCPECLKLIEEEKGEDYEQK